MYLVENKSAASVGCQWPTEFEEMNFVRKLLLFVLERELDEMTIVPREFIYGAGGMFKTTGSLKVQIIEGGIVNTGEKIEINLNGTVENNYGHNEKFALCLSLWPDSFSGHQLKPGDRKVTEDHFLEMECEHLDIDLPDSVFGFDLCLIGDPDQQVEIGQGRGYLVFGEHI